MNTCKYKPASPRLAKRCRNVKPKIAGTVVLEKKSPYFYAWRGKVNCPNSGLDLTLDFAVHLPFAYHGDDLQNIEKARKRKVYIDLVVSEDGKAVFVLKYHLHDDHGKGQCHFHEAETKGRFPKTVTLQWAGVSADMSTGDLFDNAKRAMGLTAEYHLNLTTGAKR
jgi:hypothetical protein